MLMHTYTKRKPGMISREGNAVISKEPVFFYMCFFVTCIDTSQILILGVQAVF